MAIALDPKRPARVAAGVVALSLVVVAVAMPLISSQLREVDDRVVATTRVGRLPSSVAVVGDQVNVDFDPSTGQRGRAVDAATKETSPTASVATPADRDVEARRLSWMRRGSAVVGVDRSSGDVEHQISLGNGWAYDMVRGHGHRVWVADGPGRRLLAIDSRTGRVVDEVDLGLIVPVAIDVDVDGNRAWVADYWGGQLLEVDLARAP